MKIIRNKGLLVALVILLLLIVGGFCYYLQAPKVIKLGVFVGSPWGVPDPYTFEFLDETIERFEEEHPGVRVEYTSGIQCEDYSEWLSGKIITGDAPDVFMVLPNDFSTLQKVGSLKSLDSIIKNDSSFDPKDFYEGAYYFGSCEGVQYALPMETAPDMMFVNKTLLESEGILVPEEDWTWKELYRICKRVTKDTDKNGVIDQFGIYNYSWEHAFVTNDVNPFSLDGTACDIQGDNAIEAVNFMKKLDELKTGAVVTSADFDLGKVAFMPLTLAEYRTYKPYPWSMKKYSDFDWECIPLPRGPHGSNISQMNTLLMGMNARTTKTKLSWELMKTFCNDEIIQNDVYKYRGGGSVKKAVLEQDDVLLIENQTVTADSQIDIKMIRSIMESGIADYNFEDFDTIKKMMDQGIDEMVKNDTNPQIALKSLQREINQYLDK